MTQTDVVRHRHWLLRTRAVLAGGLVLGVTATITLANWANVEYTVARFTASSFSTESNVQGTGYQKNTVSPGATVTLTGGGFAPGTSAYFPVLVPTGTASVAGTTVLTGAVLGGTNAATLGAALRDRVVRTTGACAATAFSGSPVFAVGTSSTSRTLTAGQESGITNILSAASAIAPGAPTGFCFEITLPAGTAGSLQSQAATASWKFVSTSD